MHYIDIDAIYNLKQPDSTDSFTTTKLNAKFPWPPIMPKQREPCLCIYIREFLTNTKYTSV
jgi:hypothetical protein